MQIESSQILAPNAYIMCSCTLIEFIFLIFFSKPLSENVTVDQGFWVISLASLLSKIKNYCLKKLKKPGFSLRSFIKLLA